MYQDMIRKELGAHGAAGIDPRHVEAFMRSKWGALDSLSPRQFRREIAVAIRDMDGVSVDGRERLAASYGLTVRP